MTHTGEAHTGEAHTGEEDAALAAAELVVRLLKAPGEAATEPEVGWPAVTAAAFRLGIAPLLRHRLKAAGTELALPAISGERLLTSYRLTLVCNHRLFAELAELTGAFASRGIGAIALKGTHLAATVYPDPGCRRIGDIDLLLRREHLPQAGAIMRELGYMTPLSDAPNLKDPDFHHPPGFERRGRTSVELHCRLGGEVPLSRTVEGLWRRAVPFTTPHGEALGLAPEDLLLHLALHGGHQHGFRSGLRPWFDIALTARGHPELDWDLVVERGIAGGCARWIGLALRLARDLAGAEVPAAALARLGAGAIPDDVVAIVRRRTLTEKDADHSPEQTAALTLTRGGPLLTLRRLAARTFVSPATLGELYSLPPGSWRLPLAYPRRFLDLLRRFGPHLLAALLGRANMRAVVGQEARLAAWTRGADTARS